HLRPRSELDDVLGAEELREEGAFEQAGEALLSHLLEQGEEPLDVSLPGVGPGMDQLGQVALAHGAELQEALPHEVEALSGPGDRGQLLGALARQVARLAEARKARMGRLEAPA